MLTKTGDKDVSVILVDLEPVVVSRAADPAKVQAQGDSVQIACEITAHVLALHPTAVSGDVTEVDIVGLVSILGQDSCGRHQDLQVHYVGVGTQEGSLSSRQVPVVTLSAFSSHSGEDHLMALNKRALRSILSSEGISAYDKHLEELAGAPKPKLPGGGEEARFVGTARVGRADRVGFVVQANPGDMAAWSVRIFNPNRGAAVFFLRDTKELAAFKKSFLEALDNAETALGQYDKEFEAWHEKAIEGLRAGLRAKKEEEGKA